MTRSGWLVCATAALTMAGCLGRTGLSDGDYGAAGAFDDGGGFDAGGPSADTSLPGDDGSGGDSSVPRGDTGTPDSRPPPPDSIDFFDIFPIPDSGPIGACATCVASHCAKQVNACLNDAACRAGLVCTVTKCAGGGGGGGPGGLDFGCILGCFGGDLGKAAEAISAFTCVISNCGATCGGILGGGGRDGGPGGGPGGGGDGGMSMSGGQAWTADDLQSVAPSTRIGFAAESFDAWEDVRRARCDAVAPR